MNSRAFTLIEIIIYVSIIGAVLLTFIGFLLSISKAKNKNYAISEVQNNARIALNTIVDTVRSANGINTTSSIFGIDPGVLSLSFADSQKNPTIFRLNQDDGVLQMSMASSSYLNITSNKVKITDFKIYNLSSTGTVGNVNIDFTVEFNNNDEVKNYYSQSWHTSVSPRE